jgi:uncharacterized protein YbbC (DUF1343 family)
VIATIEIRIIGLEKVFSFPFMIFLAKNNSKFKNGMPLVSNKSMKLTNHFIHRIGFKLLILAILFSSNSCIAKEKGNVSSGQAKSVIKEMKLGVELTQKYLPLITNKKVAVVSNHTSILNGLHLVDTLLSLNIDVVKVFSPEHGFRGKADAGEKVKSQKDKKTGLPIISLYGKNKKPSNIQLEGVDVLVFDIQDVGARFYTYISTLHYVMEAAAENGILVIVLDRPNPNGHYVDGPILEKEFKSFVGMHPIPVVHGMTIGEYSNMINGELWLRNRVICDLTVIKCENYSHKMVYDIPISPSPNLPNISSIYNYPSICFFEGTIISVGRGTDLPFQQIGHPNFKMYSYQFTPKPSFGAKSPKLNGQKCLGINLEEEKRINQLELKYLIDFYNHFPEKDKFFTNFFNLLAGNSKLKKQIQNNLTIEEIRKSWKVGLDEFKLTREKYLLYPDFN